MPLSTPLRFLRRARLLARRKQLRSRTFAGVLSVAIAAAGLGACENQDAGTSAHVDDLRQIPAETLTFLLEGSYVGMGLPVSPIQAVDRARGAAAVRYLHQCRFGDVVSAR